MKKQSTKLVLIDGYALLYRGFHALPELTTSKGELINAVYGFTTIMLKALEELKPTHVAVCLDRKGPTFRHKLYEEYKGTRSKAPDELHKQIPRLKEVIEAFNIPMYSMKGYEADDFIGTISKTCGVPNVIVTGDRDALQLVDKDTGVYTLGRGIKDTIVYNEDMVREKYDGLSPDQLVDYKGLAGDSSDNIPGVSGIGDKTAIKLLNEFGSLDNLYKEIKKAGFEERNKTEKLIRLKALQNLLEQEENAFLSRRLGRIVTDISINFNLEDARMKDYDKEKVLSVFKELEFKNLLNKIPEAQAKSPTGQRSLFDKNAPAAKFSLEATNNENGVTYHLVKNDNELKRLLKKLKDKKEIAVDCETTSLNAIEAEVVGISIAFKEKDAYYIAYPSNFSTDLVRELKDILEDEKVGKIGHNIKYDIIALKNAGFEIKGVSFDTMIASYLHDSTNRRYKLDDLVFQELGYKMMSYDDLTGTGRKRKLITEVSEEKLTFYAAEDADFTLRLYNLVKKNLKDEKRIQKLLDTIEMPLIDVLVDMEINGILVNPDILKKLSTHFAKELNKITAEIYKLAGTADFNIASTQQLSKILFEKLQLPTRGIKKTTRGYSTAASELEKLKNEHPIIELIEKFRELSKLKSTYVDALPKMITEKTNRIHTSFNQVGAATGRLASTDPNLQNIPIRSEYGNEIRSAFVAEKGKKLIAADYSQIDLRVIASIANDTAMIESFKNNKDIHASTASRIFGKNIEDISANERSAAKAINFGVIYGMSAFGLSQNLKISREEAKDYIDTYFERHPGIQKYMQDVVLQAEKDGFVETLAGRKRHMPELTARNAMVRKSGERIAINMPVQGTSADIIKIAMNTLFEEIKDNDKIKPLLQIHDELIFEVDESFAEKAEKLVKRHMEAVSESKLIKNLSVPLVVNTSIGNHWGELK